MKAIKKAIAAICTLCMLLAISCTAFAANYVLVDGERVVGVQFTAESSWRNINLDIGSDVEDIKLWVMCESGTMDVKVVDDDGNTISGGETHTLVSGSTNPSYIYYFSRDGYTGDYYLRVRGANSNRASGWYNWVSQYRSMSNVVTVNPEDLTKENTGRIVGTQFTAESDWKNIPLEVGDDVENIKIWVFCESGSMDVKIIDENGDTVSGGKQYTLVSGNKDDNHVYHITRGDYTGEYYLRVRGTNGYLASGWYNWASEYSLLDVA